MFPAHRNERKIDQKLNEEKAIAKVAIIKALDETEIDLNAQGANIAIGLRKSFIESLRHDLKYNAYPFTNDISRTFDGDYSDVDRNSEFIKSILKNLKTKPINNVEDLKKQMSDLFELNYDGLFDENGVIHPEVKKVFDNIEKSNNLNIATPDPKMIFKAMLTMFTIYLMKEKNTAIKKENEDLNLNFVILGQSKIEQQLNFSRSGLKSFIDAVFDEYVKKYKEDPDQYFYMHNFFSRLDAQKEKEKQLAERNAKKWEKQIDKIKIQNQENPDMETCSEDDKKKYDEIFSNAVKIHQLPPSFAAWKNVLKAISKSNETASLEQDKKFNTVKATRMVDLPCCISEINAIEKSYGYSEWGVKLDSQLIEKDISDIFVFINNDLLSGKLTSQNEGDLRKKVSDIVDRKLVSDSKEFHREYMSFLDAMYEDKYPLESDDFISVSSDNLISEISTELKEYICKELLSSNDNIISIALPSVEPLESQSLLDSSENVTLCKEVDKICSPESKAEVSDDINAKKYLSVGLGAGALTGVAVTAALAALGVGYIGLSIATLGIGALVGALIYGALLGSMALIAKYSKGPELSPELARSNLDMVESQKEFLKEYERVPFWKNFSCWEKKKPDLNACIDLKS